MQQWARNTVVRLTSFATTYGVSESKPELYKNSRFTKVLNKSVCTLTDYSAISMHFASSHFI